MTARDNDKHALSLGLVRVARQRVSMTSDVQDVDVSHVICS